MSKQRRPKKPSKPRPTVVTAANWQKLQFVFMQQFYLAGQDAARTVLEMAPDCHQDCAMNAMLSFHLGTLIQVASEADLRRLAPLILPRLVESIAIVSGMAQPHALAAPPSCNETLN